MQGAKYLIIDFEIKKTSLLKVSVF